MAITKATASSIAPAAKGDLVVGSATNDASVLAVGNNGDTLLADSAATTGLRWQSANNFNAILNGGFDFWQRSTSYTLTTTQAYGSADRWGTWQDTTAGGTAARTTDAPSNFQYAMKLGRNNGATSTGNIGLRQALESQDSYKLAGQTVTLSFYAKKGANYSGGNLSAYIVTGTGSDQSMASMGTWTGYAATTATPTLTTSYARYTVTGTLSASATQVGIWFFWTPTGTAGADDNIYISGVQLELGSVPTTFKRAGGTLQGELAACQRYYVRYGGLAVYQILGGGTANGTTQADCQVPLPVSMRVLPTSLDFSTLALQQKGGATINAITSIVNSVPNTTLANVTCNVASGTTDGAWHRLLTNNSTSGYLGISAEL